MNIGPLGYQHLVGEGLQPIEHAKYIAPIGEAVKATRKGIAHCTRCGQNVRETRLVEHHRLPECTVEVSCRKMRSEGWEKAPGIKQVIIKAGFEWKLAPTNYVARPESTPTVGQMLSRQHVVEGTWAKAEVVRAVVLLQGRRFAPPRRRYDMIKRMVADPAFYAQCASVIQLGGNIPKEW